jgi:tetratricopeptide (TPR) repeat protein
VTRVPHPILACAAAWCLAFSLAWPSAAQQPVGRLAGTVKDIVGKPIQGATVRAVNPLATPSEFTATTDPKGQWAILGMRAGAWEVSAGAPGFEVSTIAVRVGTLQANPSIQFVLVGAVVRGALEGVDTKLLQADLDAAEARMISGAWDDAIAAYRAVLAKAPPLSMVNLAIGRALRMKKDYAGAAAAYGEILKVDARNQKALLELGRTQHEQGDRSAAVATLETLIAIDGTTDEAAQARALIGQIRR